MRGNFLLFLILFCFRKYGTSFPIINFRILRAYRCGFQQQPTTSLHHCQVHEIAIEAQTVLSEVTLNQLKSLIAKRAEARWKGDYESADRIRNELNVFEQEYLPNGLRLIITDVPRSLGGGSSWSLFYDINQQEEHISRIPSVLHLAHNALNMAASYSEKGLMIPADELNSFVLRAKEQLKGWMRMKDRLENPESGFQGITAFDKLMDLVGNIEYSNSDALSWRAVEYSLTGRKAADAAFWFAMSGSPDEELFSLLTLVCVKELERFGERSTCRAKDILRIVERLAAAGVTKKGNEELVEVIKRSLETKAVQGDKLSIDPEKCLALHSIHSALLIWKQSFAMRAATGKKNIATVDADKAMISEDNRADSYFIDWTSHFADPSKPLIIDVGCGMGLSLLGLASMDESESNVDWTKYNYIGIDLSSLTINYARGISKRWEIDGRVSFVVDSADCFLEKTRCYPGKVDRVLIQFPTPYNLASSNELNVTPDSLLFDQRGNSRLPRSAHDGFMVTPELLKLAFALLKERTGELMLQSNCEDVAVWMRQIACNEAGFMFRKSDCVDLPVGTPTKRTSTWVKMGGKRAIGEGWSQEPILPPAGRTETEIACIFNDTPVHRCVLSLSALVPS